MQHDKENEMKKLHEYIVSQKQTLQNAEEELGLDMKRYERYKHELEMSNYEVSKQLAHTANDRLKMEKQIIDMEAELKEIDKEIDEYD